MSTSKRRCDLAVCNTTPLRHFALVKRLDVLAAVFGGSIRVPPQVIDPTQDPDAPDALLSEIGASVRYWEIRAVHPRALDAAARLRALRLDGRLTTCDLRAGEELDLYAQFRSRRIMRRHELAAALGRGEAAVMALAVTRRWTAVMDDAEARKVLTEEAPTIMVRTTRDTLREAVASGFLDRDEAETLHWDMLEWGYRGPPSLFSERG